MRLSGNISETDDTQFEDTCALYDINQLKDGVVVVEDEHNYRDMNFQQELV